MKEPQRIPLDPTTPRVRSVKTIPMPALRSTEEEETAAKSFWKFIAKHQSSREEWMRKKTDEND